MPEHLEDTESGTEAEAEEFKSNAAILAAVGLVSVAGAGFYFKDQIWCALGDGGWMDPGGGGASVALV